MKKEPYVGSYIDDEERELIEAIEGGEYDAGESLLTPNRLAELQKMAQNTINEERQKISLRVPRSDLARLKAKALREGVPYQTLINSLIHQAVSSWRNHISDGKWWTVAVVADSEGYLSAEDSAKKLSSFSNS